MNANNFGDVKVLIYDQNRDDLEHWADEIFGDPETATLRVRRRGALVREHLQGL